MFLSTVDWIGAAGFFWVCSLIAASGAGAMFLFLPETKGMTLEEVQRVFRNRAVSPMTMLDGSEQQISTLAAHTKL